MITATFELNEEKMSISLKIKGHSAAHMPVGCDTICASASILAYTAAQNVMIAREMGALICAPNIKLLPGDASIYCRANTAPDYEDLLHGFCWLQTGFQVLAHNYPDFVALEMFGDNDSE